MHAKTITCLVKLIIEEKPYLLLILNYKYINIELCEALVI